MASTAGTVDILDVERHAADLRWLTDGAMVVYQDVDESGFIGGSGFIGDAASPDDARLIAAAHNDALAAVTETADLRWWLTDGAMVVYQDVDESGFIGDAASPDDARRIAAAHNDALAAVTETADLRAALPGLDAILALDAASFARVITESPDVWVRLRAAVTETADLRAALVAYEADPVDLDDRPESWARLDDLLSAVRAVLAGSTDTEEPNIEGLTERDYADVDELGEAINDAIAAASGYRVMGPIAVPSYVPCDCVIVDAETPCPHG